jgi:UDP:flavonoid glycosyltransferase YjiC (YdhE family)
LLEVARRIEVCGAGTSLTPGSLTAARLRDAVRATRDRRAGAVAVARAFTAAGGPAAAADVVETLGR